MPKSKSDNKIVNKLTKPVALAAILAGFILPSRTAEASKPRPPIAEDEAFALELLRRLPSDRNQVFSPYSISLAFAMVHAGAVGRTSDEIANLFQYKEKSEALHFSLSNEAKALMTRAQQSRETLSIANRLWGERSFEFLPEYIELLRREYDAPLESVDFQTPTACEAAIKAINSWVSEKTKGKIPRIVTARDIDASTRLVLVNAIHMLAKWKNSFDPASTRELPFHSTSTTTANAKMMRKKSSFRYVEKQGEYQAVALDYVLPGLAMIVILPSEKRTLEQITKKLQPAELRSLLKGAKEEKVDLLLPRFNTKSSLSLSRLLQELGIHQAFSLQADLSRMAKPGSAPLRIGTVAHEAMIDVGEKGTEAAAATAIFTMFGAALPKPEPTKTFRADRPFLFMVRDEVSGRILFFGQIIEPKSA